MAKKKYSGRKRSKSRKKSKPRKVLTIRRTVIRRVGKATRRKSSPITRAKKTIADAAGRMLKDALYERDCATSYKQHRTAQLKVDKARRELRRVK